MTKPVGDLPLDQGEVDWSGVDAGIGGGQMSSSEKKAWELLLSSLNVIELHVPNLPLRDKIEEFFTASESTDLERLVGKLKDWQQEASERRDEKYAETTATNWAARGVLSSEMQTLRGVIKLIATEFGVGGKDGTGED